jgi:hypothetical protein
MRPEFDVTLAFNPSSTVLGVSRLGGITFSMVAPSSCEGRWEWLSGTSSPDRARWRGSMARIDPATHALFVVARGRRQRLSGGSRAAQFMLLQQAIAEVRATKSLLPGDARLLTPGGRQALAHLPGGHPLDGVCRRSGRGYPPGHRLRANARKCTPSISGGAEAWRVAPELAAATNPRAPRIRSMICRTASIRCRLDARECRATPARRRENRLFVCDDPSSQHPQNTPERRVSPWRTACPGKKASRRSPVNPAEIFGVDRDQRLARQRPARGPGFLERRSPGSHDTRRSGLYPRRGPTHAIAPD